MEMKTETQSLEEAVVLEHSLNCMNWFGYSCSKYLINYPQYIRSWGYFKWPKLNTDIDSILENFAILYRREKLK